MKRLALALLLAAAGATAHADVVWDNGLAGDNTDSGYYSSVFQDWRTFDDFTLSTNRSITHVFFQMGLTEGPFNGNFTFSVYNYLGGSSVGSQVYTKSLTSSDYVATGATISSYPYGPFYDVDFAIAPLDLGAGTYLVSFYALDMDFRSPNVGGNGMFLQQSGSDIPDIRNGDTPFRLDGVAVPEPASALLTLLGLAALGARLRRRPQ